MRALRHATASVMRLHGAAEESTTLAPNPHAVHTADGLMEAVKGCDACAVRAQLSAAPEAQSQEPKPPEVHLHTCLVHEAPCSSDHGPEKQSANLAKRPWD